MRPIHTRNSVSYMTTRYRGSASVRRGSVSSRDPGPANRTMVRDPVAIREVHQGIGVLYTIEVPVTGEQDGVQDGDARRDDVETREEAISPDTTNGVDGWGSRPTQHRAARRDTKEISRPPCWRWLRNDRGLTIM